jgi:hypothetical protein
MLSAALLIHERNPALDATEMLTMMLAAAHSALPAVRAAQERVDATRKASLQ